MDSIYKFDWLVSAIACSHWIFQWFHWVIIPVDQGHQIYLMLFDWQVIATNPQSFNMINEGYAHEAHYCINASSNFSFILRENILNWFAKVMVVEFQPINLIHWSSQPYRVIEFCVLIAMATNHICIQTLNRVHELPQLVIIIANVFRHLIQSMTLIGQSFPLFRVTEYSDEFHWSVITNLLDHWNLSMNCIGESFLVVEIIKGNPWISLADQCHGSQSLNFSVISLANHSYRSQSSNLPDAFWLACHLNRSKSLNLMNEFHWLVSVMTISH